ncbi:MAG TPA: hypothetical protein PLJ78_02205 [Anaerolineae bacterium]|nr:hypothetical protein [Anaerolineae bacterium]HQK12738.1 hypothetical protein [Anaerolineae bacterium]
MLKAKKRIMTVVLGSLVLAAVIAGVWYLGTPATVRAANTLQTVTQSAMPGLFGDGYLNCGGGWGFPGQWGQEIDYQQLLADALGISVEDLQAAYQKARDAAIDQAVEQGLLTQEQADEMKVWGGFGFRGGFGGFGRAPKGLVGAVDENALLAEALGITVDKLEAARDAANQAALAQAVEKGLITQEQADAMLAHKNLQSYVNRDTLLAKALGMSLEDLQAAYAEGKTLSTLMREKGLDAATVREKLQTAYAEALAQAVKDGVITQEQADTMLKDGYGFRMMPPDGMPFGGRGGWRGRGGYRGMPSGSDTDGSSGTGMRFRRGMSQNDTDI